MMKAKYIIMVAIAAMLATTAAAKKQPVPKVYIFGMAATFNDTIVHFTPIQEVDSAWMDTKTDFLLGREVYSYQLRDYLAAQQMPHRTCIVVADTDRKKLEKKYLKMKKLYTQPKPEAQHYDVRYLTDIDFHFKAYDASAFIEEADEETAQMPVKPAKKSKKTKLEGSAGGK